MSGKIKRIAALLLASAMLFTACGSDEPSSSTSSEDAPISDAQEVQEMRAADSVFSLNYDAEAGINPISAKSSTNMQFWSLMYDSVFTVESDFTVTSDIVTKVETTDYQWWVFYIDTSIVMHDGSTLTAVEGYVPLVAAAAPPEGGGTLLERVNLLNGKRRVQFSPDGAATVFHLPETNIDEVNIKMCKTSIFSIITFYTRINNRIINISLTCIPYRIKSFLHS